MPVPIPNSSTGGYLVPTSTPPPFDDALDDIFHDVLQGVLGITDATLIRPRFQPEPPDEPEPATNWIAFGIVDSEEDWNPFITFDPQANGVPINPNEYGFLGSAVLAVANLGSDMLTGPVGAIIGQHDEQFVLSVSYYGPGARGMQSMFEAGIKLDQNREVLDTLGIKFMGCAGAYRLPVLLQQKWVNRIDQKITFRRRVVRQYAVLSFTAGHVTLDNEQYRTGIDVTTP